MNREEIEKALEALESNAGNCKEYGRYQMIMDNIDSIRELFEGELDESDNDCI